MYTKCIQNITHILTNLCIHFVYKIKRTMAAKFCIQNVYKSLSKCGMHFIYILYTSILIYKKCTSRNLCIQNYEINMYTKFIQNVYTNNCIQNGSHISTYFDSFNVLFLVNIAYKLRLGTCWLSSWRSDFFEIFYFFCA